MTLPTRISVIGAGRVGGALAARSPIDCDLVTRDAGWEALDAAAGAPVVVAARNDDLDDVLARVPAHRRPDLVFVQNGILEPWLKRHGLEDSTRGLLYFAVARRGAPIEPGGTSLFTGPHAAALVDWLRAMRLPASEAAPDEFRAEMLEKLLWNTSFGLLCEVHDCSVGEVLELHIDPLAALVRELAEVGRAGVGVALETESLLDRLCAYARAIPTYRGAVKDWPWRNGWFVETARAHGLATPVHDGLLRSIGR